MDTKQDYQRVAEAKLKTLEAQFELLKAKVQEEGAEAKHELSTQLDKLRSTIDDGREELEKLTDMSEEAWEDSKAKLENLWDKTSGFLEGVFGGKEAKDS